MPNRLTRLQVQNFRSLQDVSIELGAVNVLFGPNGAGKSSLLDTIWFVRDCAVRGVEEASSFRNHGIGALWDGAEYPVADEGAHISIKVESQSLEYEISFAFSSGRIDPLVGEAGVGHRFAHYFNYFSLNFISINSQFRISDCGLRNKCALVFRNPQSAIRNC